MRPAFSYYGGKQRMIPNLLPLIPKHTVYVEPFAGGASLFFAKPKPLVRNTHHYREVLNDIDSRIVNFFAMLRDKPDELIRACALTPYSRRAYQQAADDPDLDPIERARRWYVDIEQSFANLSRVGWGFGMVTRNDPATFVNGIKDLEACAKRLQGIYIECDDAIKVIKRWDSPQTLFYCDPPYPGTNQGHYKGYTLDDLTRLIETLNHCEGSFLLSNYDQKNIPKHWERFEFQAHCSASGQGKTGPNRDKSRAATVEELGDRTRTEIVWRRFNSAPVRPEIEAIYQSGAFDCFADPPDRICRGRQLALEMG